MTLPWSTGGYSQPKDGPGPKRVLKKQTPPLSQLTRLRILGENFYVDLPMVKSHRSETQEIAIYGINGWGLINMI